MKAVRWFLPIILVMAISLFAIIGFTSCGIPDDIPRHKFETQTQPLEVAQISFSSMPTAKFAALFFAPQGGKALKAWPDPQSRILCLNEWVKDYRKHFRLKLTYQPFFQRAECIYNGSTERWDLTTRYNGADISVAINGGYTYGNGVRHDGIDLNRYDRALNPLPKGLPSGCNHSDYGAPVVSPCDGVIITKGATNTSFGNQVDILCKYRKPWRTAANLFHPLVPGFEFIVFKASHLSAVTIKSVGQSVYMGEEIGKVGASSHRGNTWCTHLHASIHRESMLRRCNANGDDNASGQHICLAKYQRASTATVWPPTYTGNSGYQFIRNNYYDPLEFVKAHSGDIKYSKNFSVTMRTPRVRGLSTKIALDSNIDATLVIDLVNLDYLRRNDNSQPPQTQLRLLTSSGQQILAGGEFWDHRNRRLVVRNTKNLGAITLQIYMRNHQDKQASKKLAYYQLNATSYPHQKPFLGHYGNPHYPRIPSRTELSSDLGYLYYQNRLGTSEDNRKARSEYNHLKTVFDQSVFQCKSRYRCQKNRQLTRCDLAVMLATFLNYQVSSISTAQSEFSDLQPNDSCYPFALALKKHKITILKNDLKFHPKAIANRAEAVTMFVRAVFGEPKQTLPSSFSDISSSHWASPYFTIAAQHKVIYGCGPKVACPTSPIVAAHFALMLARYMGISDAKKLVYNQQIKAFASADGVGGGYCKDCSCPPKATALCGINIGVCKSGIATCKDGIWDTSQCSTTATSKVEICNGQDDDCDGQIDNLNGFQKPLEKVCTNTKCATSGIQKCSEGKWSKCTAKTCKPTGPNCIDNDGDGFGEGKDCLGKDCDDNNSQINPNSLEICNGQDDDCDGQIDNQSQSSDPIHQTCTISPCGNRGQQVCENGKWGICTGTKCPPPCIDHDNDGYFAKISDNCPGVADCNDKDATVNPGRQEDCNGKDDDCDGFIDNQTSGQNSPLATFCINPFCNKKTPITCQNGKWELCKTSKCPVCSDKDRDGFKVGGINCQPIDCNDQNSNINPQAPEICNGQDDDCDGQIDNQKSSTSPITRTCQHPKCANKGQQTCAAGSWTKCDATCNDCVDQDKDGYYTGGPHCGPKDCADNNPKINPGAEEICDGIDNNCDGKVDISTGTNQPLQYTCTNSICSKSGTQTCRQGVLTKCTAKCPLCQDQDQDGFKSGGDHCKPKDCNDQNSAIHPVARELCDHKDNNCNGKIDENLRCDCKPGDQRLCYPGPANTANKGICQSGTQYCSANAKGASWGKCQNAITPQAELCDNRDNNCNGQIDEGCQCSPGHKRPCGIHNPQPWCKSGTQVCTSKGQWGSCNGIIRKSETCNNQDDDCDGQTDENLQRSCYPGSVNTADKGVCKSGVQVCSKGKWGKCSGSILPRSETCNNQDDDCNGKIDDQLTLPCYQSKPSTKNVGICRSGIKVCNNGSWSSCQNAVYPKAEVCNGQDDNCDGFIDNSGTSSNYLVKNCRISPCNFQGKSYCTTGKWSQCHGPTCPVTCQDNDRDGYNTGPSTTCQPLDCDDNDSSIQPGAIETCDGKDNNCDGLIDVTQNLQPITRNCFAKCGNSGTQVCLVNKKTWAACVPKTPCPNCTDQDRDGYGQGSDCKGPDCNDLNRTINPSASEKCNGVDDDCDGFIDNQTRNKSASLQKNCVSSCGTAGISTCQNGSWQTCKASCSKCGDGFCDYRTENCASCSQDCRCPSGQYCNTTSKACRYYCGNGIADNNETCSSCPADVKCPTGTYCSNGKCTNNCGNGQHEAGENCRNCPQDVKCLSGQTCDSNGVCVNNCGNGKIDPGENCINCGLDVRCASNQYCNTSTKTCLAKCGNGQADFGETCSSCPADIKCPSGYTCNSGACISTCTNPCSGRECGRPACGKQLTSCGTCGSGKTCRNYKCISTGPICGNGTCESGENCSSCAQDCGCSSGQSCQNGQCKSVGCNCNSKQYCLGSVCKDRFIVRQSGFEYDGNSGLATLGFKLIYNGGTTFTYQVKKGGINNQWLGQPMTFQIRFRGSLGCGFRFGSPKRVKLTGTQIYTDTINLSCVSFSPYAGGGLYVEIKSPASCTFNACTYQTGTVYIKRYK